MEGRRRHVLLRSVQHVGERVVGLVRPEAEEVLVGAPPEEQGAAVGHAFAHRPAHDLVVVRPAQPPWAKPPRSSSSGRPGACITPSSVRCSIAVILRTGRSLRDGRYCRCRPANSSTRPRPSAGQPQTRYSKPAASHSSIVRAMVVEVVLERERRRPQDLGRVAAGGLGHASLSRSDFGASTSGAAEAVPHVGVARRDRHHALLARRADPDRRVRLLHRPRVQRGVAATWKCAPSNVKPSVVSRPRTICTASSNASMRSFSAGNGMPSSRCSSSNQAAPYDELEPPARRVVDGDRLGREHRRGGGRSCR